MNNNDQSTATPATEITFEAALDRLETLVAEMEAGKISLDACMKKFTEGMQLAGLCTKKLGEAEKKIEILMKKSGGDGDWQPFAPPADAGADADADA